MNPIERPARLGPTDGIKIGKGIWLRNSNASVVVANESCLVSGNPDRKVVGSFPRRAEELKFNSAKREFVLFVKENRRIDLRPVVPRPRTYRLRPRSERSGIAWRKEALKPLHIVHELHVVPLRDDLSSVFLPQRDPADVIGMAMCQDYLLHGPRLLRSQEFSRIPRHIGSCSVDDYISRRCTHQVYIARSRRHIDGVVDLEHLQGLVRGVRR